MSSPRLHRTLRRLSAALMAAGALTLVWAAVVYFWQDPFTALYTMYEQHELSQAYDQRVSGFTVPSVVHAPTAGVTRAHKAPVETRAMLEAEEKAIALVARSYRLSSHEGEPLGRIIVPRLSLNMIFVDGTTEGSLAKGPGRDLETSMPGEGRLVYIAGHRTTFLAPFSNINLLRAGDTVTLKLPYATFVYSVTRHIIVLPTDSAVLSQGKVELLALQACQPRFFATHRYIVYARPIEVIPNPKLGSPYSLARGYPSPLPAGSLEAQGLSAAAAPGSTHS